MVQGTVGTDGVDATDDTVGTDGEVVRDTRDVCVLYLPKLLHNNGKQFQVGGECLCYSS